VLFRSEQKVLMMQIPITFFLLSSLVATQAVLYGDEGYANLDGNFWAFYSGGIAVINPETCLIETTIDKDQFGNPLPDRWADGIYMQFHNRTVSDSRRQLHENHDHSIRGYVMINSGVNRYDNATGDKVSDVYAVSTESRAVTSIVQVGPGVVHSYGIHTRDEFWTHSDDDGHFYVIDLSDLTKYSDKVKAHEEFFFHGKLLWDEDGTLGNRGYATSTGERFLFQLDMLDGELTRSYDFSKDVLDGTCFGLHGIAYSSVNQHIYAECVGGSATLEFDVDDPDKIVFVAQHFDITGALYEVPDGSYVVAANKGDEKLHVFKPNANGVKSTNVFNANVPGRPDTPSFYPLDDVDGGADFMACMPLTNNPNADQINGTGYVKCDYYNGCTNASTAEDVNNGVCLHSFVNGVSPNQLMRVTSVTNNTACLACSNSSNFVNGTCTCTPQCGSCDKEFEVDLNKTGVACIDLGAVVDGSNPEAKLIPNAGAVQQGVSYSNADECTYGRTYRSHKRGKKYDASVSNYPNSIVIVDMSTQQVKCQVNLTGPPSRVVYAPTFPNDVEGVGPPEATESTIAPGATSTSGALTALDRVSMTIGLVLAIGVVMMA